MSNERFSEEMDGKQKEVVNKFWSEPIVMRQNTMTWLPIDPDNLPEGEVLAGNFEPGTQGYKEKIVGYCNVTVHGNAFCESEGEVLLNVTHYIDIHKFDPQ